jgi:hypothetical protein
MKTDIFMASVKKTKKNTPRKKLILVPNFVIFTYTTYKVVFLETTRGDVEHGYIHKIFLFIYFKIFKYMENANQIKGAFHPGAKKSHVRQFGHI